MLRVTCFVATILVVALLPLSTLAAVENSSSKITVSSAFVFPDPCTGEYLDVTVTDTVSCHDQVHADGLTLETCEIREQIDALGAASGWVFHGTGTFQQRATTADPCNFEMTNRGSVRLITAGAAHNIVLSFEDHVVMEGCALTLDDHLVDADCRGRAH